MDALKSAGRAIIRSPSIAKQSWASGRHKSEFTPGNRPDINVSLLMNKRGAGCFCVEASESFSFLFRSPFPFACDLILHRLKHED